MSYREEFPDYDGATLPAIPDGWTDISWRNDDCPSWDAGNGVSVYIDYADPAQREWPENERFTVIRDAWREYRTEDWAEALRIAAECVKALAEMAAPDFAAMSAERLNDWYQKRVGIGRRRTARR